MNKLYLLIVIFLFSSIYPFIKSDAVGRNGIVVSSKEIASNVGIDILKKGGNAIDAAVAVGFALSVVHPAAGNLGGGGFMVIRFANGETTTIDFREKAPMKSSRDMYLDFDGNVIPGLSWSSSLSTGVPGTVAGLGYAHKKYGSLDWDVLLSPSIFLSKYGFELDYHNIEVMNSSKYKEKLSNDTETREIFTKNLLFQIGDIFIQQDLSSTLTRIGYYGFNEFYYGETSDFIIDCMNRTNGIITYDDLISYNPIERPTINFNYKGYEIFSMPPPSSGGITLANILNQLENIDLSTFGLYSVDHIHYFVEAERRAYADRAFYLGDTDFVNVPIDYLTSKDYALERYHTISSQVSTDSKDIYNKSDVSINNESEETTHYSIVDKFGNAVSVTTTLNGWYGNGITVDNAGFLLNNEMDDFSIKPGYPNAYGLVGNKKNAIEKNKRMLSSMTPTIVESEDKDLFMVLGSPGGSTIISTIAQIIVNVIDFNMSMDDAVESKRFHHQCLPDVIQLEHNSISNDVIKKLKNMGHEFYYRSQTGIGEANCIMKKNDYYYGSADSRRNASALGY